MCDRSVSHVLALEHMLCASERALFPLVWRGGWLRYGYTYMVGSAHTLTTHSIHTLCPYVHNLQHGGSVAKYAPLTIMCVCVCVRCAIGCCRTAVPGPLRTPLPGA